MDKYTVNEEKYRQLRNKHIKRLAIYFSIPILAALLFSSVFFYITGIDFTISIISLAFTLSAAVLIIYFTLKTVIKTNDDMILNTTYEVNEEILTISNQTENLAIEKNDIKKIERYKNDSIGIIMNKLGKKIIYANCVENHGEFYEKLNQLREIQEYKNKAMNIIIGIFGGIIVGK
jgi:hypothetical protein